MENNTMTWTALEPTFGMPTYGPASSAAPRILACPGTRVEVGERQVTGIADVRVKGAFPGSPAWRPPTC